MIDEKMRLVQVEPVMDDGWVDGWTDEKENLNLEDGK